MAISIQTNANSLIAQENLRVNNDFQARTIGRLTSGFRINASGDDAAGLAVANKFRSDTTELTQGVRNANDGISQLQIIDGGLSNISKMLDRMKTLATQSASTTFTGDRSTLQAEFGALQGEIDRQAANIGLGTNSGTDTQATRFLSNMSVYIGGGSAQANSAISVDLSNAKVDTNGLSLTTTIKVGGTATPTSVTNANALTDTNLVNTTQRLDFAFGDGKSASVTLSGGTAGIDAATVISQINDVIGKFGVTASTDSSDKLTLAGSDSFAMEVTTVTGAGNLIATTGSDTLNTAVSNFQPLTLAAVGTADQVVTFKDASGGTIGEGGAPLTLAFTGSTADLVYQSLSNHLKDTAIDVMRIGNKVFFQSTSGFSVGVTSGGASTGGVVGLDNGPDAALALAASVSAAAASSASDVTYNAKQALTAISDAVTKLGTVQGTVGTGQNKLSYAINLAQSQISNFSAAESRIRDTDVAAEAANLTKASVLSQASMAAMAQANSAPQAVLALLRG